MKSISCKNIKKHNPETFVKLDEFYKNYLKKSVTVFQIIKINQEIIKLSNDIKEQYDKNKIATHLYIYYYNHLDKYIEKKPNNIDCSLIEFFILKHNSEIINYNIKQDYF